MSNDNQCTKRTYNINTIRTINIGTKYIIKTFELTVFINVVTLRL